MPFGILDTTFIDLPLGIDSAYLQRLRLADGVTFAQIMSNIDQRVAVFNATQDPLVAELVTAPTNQETIETQVPGIFDTEESAEYAVPRPQLPPQPIGYHIPIRGYDVGLQFTEDGLKKMSSARVLNHVDSALRGMRRRHRRQVLARFFSNLEVRVDENTTAVSPGFAGSGTGYNVFTEAVQFYPDNNEPILSGYTHYHRTATADAAGVQAAAATMRGKLRRWYGQVPFDLVGSQAVLDIITGMSTAYFIPSEQLFYRPGVDTPVSTVDPKVYAGVLLGDILVRWPIADFTDATFSIFRPGSPGDPENPLVWRYDAVYGSGAYVRSRSLYPLDASYVKQKFGIGVNRRTAATFCTVAASGSYVNPLALS